MATFLGDRESLTPGSKRKRSRSKPSDKGDGPLSSSVDSEGFESPTQSKRKRKKEKKAKEHQIQEEAVESIVQDEVEETTHVDPASPGTPALHGTGLSEDTMLTLLGRIEACCVKEPARLMSWSCQQEKLDWEAIAFDPLSADECKEAWTKISTKVRKFRTLPELIAEARDKQAQVGGVFGYNKKKMMHPDMPKKPLSGYLRFFLEKRLKYSKKHHELKGYAFTKFMGSKYTELSDARKEKYNKQYQHEMTAYKEKMEKFKAEHPDLLAELESGRRERVGSRPPSSGGPPKVVTAQGIYIQEKIVHELEKDAHQSRRELFKKLQEKWKKKVSDKKKWKYIEMAIEAKKKYDADMEEYCKTHPEYEPKVVTSFLTIAEQKKKDDKDGKPHRPPSNAYQRFTIKVIKNSKVPSSERMEEAATLWKALEPEDKEIYVQEVKEMKEEYFKQLLAYTERLSEEEQQVYQAELAKLDKDLHGTLTRTEKKKPAGKPPTVSATAKSDRKPVTAMFLYIKDHKAAYVKKFPGVSAQDISRHFVDLYNKLPHKQKAPYEEKAREEKQRLEDEALATAAENAATTQQGPKQVHQQLVNMGEPPKPSGSGYLLYSRQQLKEMTHVESSQRMKAISEAWKTMTEGERAVYNDKRTKMWKSYEKKLAKFVQGLSESNVKKYYDLKGHPRKAKVAAAAAAQKAAAAKDAESSESSVSAVSSESSVSSVSAVSAVSAEEDSDDDDENKENVDKAADSSDDSDDDDEEEEVVVKTEPDSTDSSSDSSNDEEEEESDEVDQTIVNGTKVGAKDNKRSTSDVFNSSDSDSDDDDDDKKQPKKGHGKSVVKMSPLKSPSKAKHKSPIKIARKAKANKSPTPAPSSSSADTGSVSNSSDSDSD